MPVPYNAGSVGAEAWRQQCSLAFRSSAPHSCLRSSFPTSDGQRGSLQDIFWAYGTSLLWQRSLPSSSLSAILASIWGISMSWKDGSREERRRKRGRRHKWLTDSWQMDFGAMQKVLIQPLSASTWLICAASLLYLANRTQKALLPWPKTWLCVCSWPLQPWM